jgi:hypothetical protein
MMLIIYTILRILCTYCTVFHKCKLHHRTAYGKCECVRTQYVPKLIKVPKLGMLRRKSRKLFGKKSFYRDFHPAVPTVPRFGVRTSEKTNFLFMLNADFTFMLETDFHGRK